MSGGTLDARDASERDAEACAAIYALYVTDTAITFESDPPLPAEMAERIRYRRTHGSCSSEGSDWLSARTSVSLRSPTRPNW